MLARHHNNNNLQKSGLQLTKKVKPKLTATFENERE